MPPGEYSRAAKIARLAEKEDHHILLQCAYEYAVGHDIGARKVVSSMLFVPVGVNELHNLLTGRTKHFFDQRKSTDVLTKDEERKLAAWITDSARGKDAATDLDISDRRATTRARAAMPSCATSRAAHARSRCGRRRQPVA